MSSLDLISCGRVRLGQQVPESISKEKSGAAGIVGRSSVGGTLSIGIHPKCCCRLLDGSTRVAQVPVTPQGPRGLQAEPWVSSLFARVDVAAEPCVGTAGSMSIIKTCHHAVPLWENTMWAWRWAMLICSITCYPPPAKQNLWRSRGKETEGSSPSRMLGPDRRWKARRQD